jgi:hypothetical protein
VPAGGRLLDQAPPAPAAQHLLHIAQRSYNTSTWRRQPLARHRASRGQPISNSLGGRPRRWSPRF